MVNDTDEDSLFRNEYCVPPQTTSITYIKEHQVGHQYLFKFQCNTLFTRTDGPDEGEVQCLELDNLNVKWSEVDGAESLPQCVFNLYIGILLGVSIFLLLLSLIFIFLYCRNRTESRQKVKRMSELAGFDNQFSHHSDDGNQPRYYAHPRSRSGSLQPQPTHSPQPRSRSGSLQPHRSPNEPLPPTPGRRHIGTMSVISDSSNVYMGADSDQEDRLDSLPIGVAPNPMPPMPAPNWPGAHSGLDDDYMCSNTSGPDRLNISSDQQEPGPSNVTRQKSWRNRLSTGIKRTLSTFRPKLAQNPTFSADGKHNSYGDEEENVDEIALPVKINRDASLDSDSEQGDKRESHI